MIGHRRMPLLLILAFIATANAETCPTTWIQADPIGNQHQVGTSTGIRFAELTGIIRIISAFYATRMARKRMDTDFNRHIDR